MLIHQCTPILLAVVLMGQHTTVHGVLPPGFEDIMYCPEGYCDSVVAYVDGFTGPERFFHECINLDTGDRFGEIWTGEQTDIIAPTDWVESPNVCNNSSSTRTISSPYEQLDYPRFELVAGGGATLSDDGGGCPVCSEGQNVTNLDETMFEPHNSTHRGPCHALDGLTCQENRSLTADECNEYDYLINRFNDKVVCGWYDGDETSDGDDTSSGNSLEHITISFVIMFLGGILAIY